MRTNQLVGYGLVVGLDGTGDQTTSAPFTTQSLTALLQRFGARAEHAAFVGNDVNDLPALRAVGLPVVVGDAHPDALAAARALKEHSTLTAPEIVRKGLEIAGDICIYTNRNLILDEIK